MQVTVIIPLFNKARTILRTLRSVTQQTVADIEVLVVDDASTDGSARRVAGYPDRRVRLIPLEHNSGPGRARNVGLQQARAPLVAFIDADDEWLPHYLENAVTLLQRYGEGTASVSSGYYLHPKGRSTGRWWTKRGIRDGVYRVTSTDTPQQVLTRLAYMSPWSTVARTDTVRRYGGFFDRTRCLYAEDAWLWIQVLFNEQVAFCTTPLVRFHSEDSGLSTTRRTPREIEPFLEYPEELLDVCPPHLRPLLQQVLAARAYKTSCVLTYWGKWRRAGQLRRKFNIPNRWRVPWFTRALLCTNPLGAATGALMRRAAHNARH